MAMGKRPAARRSVPMWVHSEDLPTSDGHPFFARLNRILEDSGFDAFVEELCSSFYAERQGRPSLQPGRYFRLLFIGFFEGVSSERGISWRVADSLSLRSFLDLTEAAPDHSTLSRTRRRIDEETHLAYKVEHGVDMDIGAIVAVTVQDASTGDTATLTAMLTKAVEQVEAVQPDGREVEEVVQDKGYHSDETLVALDELEVRSHISEPERGPRRWQDKWTGETPPEKRAAQKALYGNRRRIVGLGGVVCNGGVESWWSVRSRISMRPGGCGGCGCGVMRTCASGC